MFSSSQSPRGFASHPENDTNPLMMIINVITMMKAAVSGIRLLNCWLNRLRPFVLPVQKPFEGCEQG